MRRQTRNDLVRPARQALEHRLGLRSTHRLAQCLPVDDHLGVDPQHRPVTAVHRTRLPGRQLDRIRPDLLELGRNDIERNAQLRENRAALRRDRSEQDRRRRRNAHPRLRAFQISSAGHWRAHSAETKP